MGRGRSIAAAVLVAGLLAACGADTTAPDTTAPEAAPSETGAPEPAASAPDSPSPADGLSQEPLAPDDPAVRPTAAAAAPPEGLAADVFGFSAPLVGGGQVEGGEFAGQDLALWFWAPW